VDRLARGPVVPEVRSRLRPMRTTVGLFGVEALSCRARRAYSLPGGEGRARAGEDVGSRSAGRCRRGVGAQGQRGCEELDAATSVVLGAVERDVGVADKASDHDGPGSCRG